MAIQIQIRRDTAANWASVNPILADGEPAYEKDTRYEKVGDGINHYNDLPYKRSGILEMESATYANDSFYVLGENYMLEKILIIPEGTINIKIGSSPNADDILFETEITSAGLPCLVIVFARGASKTLYLTGISASTKIFYFKIKIPI
jgi:hypothetical protein